MEAGQECSRCGQGHLEVDEEEGFLLCPNCGNIADEHLLVDQAPGGGPAGVMVLEGGEALLSAPGGGDWAHGVGRAARSDHRARYLRGLQDKVAAAASRLGLSGRHVEEASSLIQQVYESRTLHLSVPHAAEALGGAALLLVVRTNKLPASLTEVAGAAQAPKGMVASMYRRLCAQPAAGVAQLEGESAGGLLRPSLSLRALCIKYAVEVLQHSTPEEAASTTDWRCHPLVKTALEMADLVAKTGVGEGRPPPIMAGAILWVASEAPNLQRQGLSPVDPQQLVQVVGCMRQTLVSTKTLLQEQLLQLAALLPMGGMITKANLMAYLPLIITATHTIVALKRQTQQQQPQLPAPQPQEQQQLLPAPLQQLPLPALQQTQTHSPQQDEEGAQEQQQQQQEAGGSAGDERPRKSTAKRAAGAQQQVQRSKQRRKG